MREADRNGIGILVAEDHDLVRESLRRMLADLGYSVLTARSGGEALSTCREHSDKITILLVDVVMPDMSGPTVAAEARTIVPGVRSIFMSGYPGAVLEDHGVGAEETYLVKPFRASDIEAAIERVLGAKG